MNSPTFMSNNSKEDFHQQKGNPLDEPHRNQKSSFVLRPQDKEDVTIKLFQEILTNYSPEKIKTPKFSGKESEDVNIFLENFSAVRKFNRCTNQTVLDAFPLALKGNATIFQ